MPALFRCTVDRNVELNPGYFKMGLSGKGISEGVTPGRFLMLKVGDGYDPLLRRPFAYYAIESDYVEILYRVVGRGTRLMAAVAPGGTIEILGPLGKGFTVPTGLERAVVVAGGIGVASIAMLVSRLGDAGVRTLLVYGAKTAQDLVEIDGLRAAGVDVRTTVEIGPHERTGTAVDLFDSLLRSMPMEEMPSECFACGPWPMLSEISAVAKGADMSCQVSVESRMACGFGACQGCAVSVVETAGEEEYVMVCRDGPVFDVNSIEWKKNGA